MVASGVSVILVASLLAAYVQQRRTFRTQELVGLMQQNTRTAMMNLAMDVRNAGYGINLVPAQVAAWIPWVGGVTSTVSVVDGGTQPDALLLVGAFGLPEGQLASAVASGATTLVLGSGEGSRFNTTTRSVVHIGKVETARVTHISGDTLTLSASPTAHGVGLEFDYPAGAPVEIVKVIRYSVVPDGPGNPFGPYLAREDLALTYVFAQDRVNALNIEDLQARRAGDDVEFSVTGRVSVADRTYRHPDRGDGFRRTVLESRVALRNIPRR